MSLSRTKVLIRIASFVNRERDAVRRGAFRNRNHGSLRRNAAAVPVLWCPTGSQVVRRWFVGGNVTEVSRTGDCEAVRALCSLCVGRPQRQQKLKGEIRAGWDRRDLFSEHIIGLSTSHFTLALVRPIAYRSISLVFPEWPQVNPSGTKWPQVGYGCEVKCKG